MDEIIRYTNEYYAHIPKVFGRKIRVEEIAINSMEKVAEELDILKFYEDSLRMGGVLYDTSNIDKQYESLKSDIAILDPTSQKYQEIVDYVHSTESIYHDVTLDVIRIFTVKQKKCSRIG